MLTFRLVTVAFTIAFKMLAESDCIQIHINKRLAEYLNVPLPQFNLMEIKVLEALNFDAMIQSELLTKTIRGL